MSYSLNEIKFSAKTPLIGFYSWWHTQDSFLNGLGAVYYDGNCNLNPNFRLVSTQPLDLELLLIALVMTLISLVWFCLGVRKLFQLIRTPRSDYSD